jgi:DNA polymerase III subunit beta
MTLEITVPTNYLRAALICASTKKVRYYLNGVYVDPDGFLVSTDGHRAFVGKIDLTDVPAFDGWIICRDVLKRALTGYKARDIVISPTRTGNIACKPVDGVFPEWRRVVTSELSGVTAQFNNAYVGDFGKIDKLLAGRTVPSAHIHHNGDGPAGVTFPDIQNAFGVLMPVRGDDTAGAWAARHALVYK